MKKHGLVILSLLCSGIAVTLLPAFGADKAGKSDQSLLSCKTVRQKEVKYIAGPDKIWFTIDDLIYHYFVCEYDNKGNVVRKKCYTIGLDKTPFTEDDKLEDCEVFKSSANGEVVGSVLFNVPGADGKWFTDDDVARYSETYEFDKQKRKSLAVRAAGGRTIRIITYSYNDKGQNISDAEYTASGEDGKWGTADDVLEKWHRYEFDVSGKLEKSSEFHAGHGGQGKDGKWFTDDDVIFATKKHIYGADGQLVKELKCIGSGVDGKWFTEDDVLQYYTIMSYAAATER